MKPHTLLLLGLDSILSFWATGSDPGNDTVIYEDNQANNSQKMTESSRPKTPDAPKPIVHTNLTAKKTTGAYAESISTGPELIQNYGPTNVKG